MGSTCIRNVSQNSRAIGGLREGPTARATESVERPTTSTTAEIGTRTRSSTSATPPRACRALPAGTATSPGLRSVSSVLQGKWALPGAPAASNARAGECFVLEFVAGRSAPESDALLTRFPSKSTERTAASGAPPRARRAPATTRALWRRPRKLSVQSVRRARSGATVQAALPAQEASLPT